MSNSPNNHAPIIAESEADEVSFLDFLIVLAKRKTFILGTTVGTAMVAAIVSLLLPNIYTGTARLLPPQQNQSTASMLLGQLGGLAALSGASLGLKNPNDLYVGMLKSRTVADKIITQFDLQRLYERDTMEDTRKQFANLSTIISGKDGLITVEFDDEDPQRAAAIANAYVEQLESLTQNLAVTEAAQRRLFFERQLQEAKRDLSDAEIALKVTQERTGLIKLDDQGKAIIEAVAALRAQISSKEIELRSMRTFATEGNPHYVRGQQELAGLRGELAKLERAHVAGGGDVLLTTGKVPEAGLEYLRRFRDVKYQEAIFEILAKQFEAAKIDEAKESAIIQIVDRAVVPDRKSKPQRSIIVILFALLGGFVALVVAFVREAHEKARANPNAAARLDLLRGYLGLRARR